MSININEIPYIFRLNTSLAMLIDVLEYVRHQDVNSLLDPIGYDYKIKREYEEVAQKLSDSFNNCYIQAYETRKMEKIAAQTKELMNK
jgi:hypothetical protein